MIGYSAGRGPGVARRRQAGAAGGARAVAARRCGGPSAASAGAVVAPCGALPRTGPERGSARVAVDRRVVARTRQVGAKTTSGAPTGLVTAPRKEHRCTT